MKRQIVLCSLILLFLGSYAAATSGDYEQGEVLVRFVTIDGQPLSLSQKTLVLTSVLPGSTVIKSYGLVSGLSLIKLPEGISVLISVEKISASPAVLYAQPNYIYRTAAIPNDEFFSEQWALHNTGQTGGTVDADIDAPEAWDIHTGSSDIVVGVVDTGIDYNHPDLGANLWVNEPELNGLEGVDDDGNGYIDDIYGWNSVAGNGDPMDDNFHGTHCAGIVGAVGNNGMGVAGVCWNVKIMALKFLDWTGSGSTADAVECFEYAQANGAKILSNSWGGYYEDPALHDAISILRDAGILFVAAAGNESIDNDGGFSLYPASYDLDNIISVMATDHDDQMASFSNYGATTVDIGAPGVDILSTFPTYETNDMNLFGFDTYYETIGGTSMSTPFVAGAAALGWSFLPELDYDAVRDAILYSADPLASLNGRCVTGGRLNLQSMLLSLNTQVLNKDTGLIYRGIQAAIDAVETLSGHTLIADKGPEFIDKIYFFEAIDFKGKNIILRSGDVDNPDDETVYPEKVIISGRGQNTHTVVFDGGENSSAVLKGFTITEGYATGATILDKSGGGIYLEGSSPTISDCIITGNRAFRDGGGIHCEDGADPLIMNCTISDNIAGGMDGGGIYCYDSSPQIINCLIVNNRSNRDGGGIYFNGSSTAGEPVVNNCTIADNSGNVIDGLGGGIYCYWDSKPEIKDCIFSGNPGYAIYEEDSGSDPVLTFCLFHSNPDGDYYDADTMTVYTGPDAINSLDEASDNIDGDPIFVTGHLGDYYLSQTDAGQLDDSDAVDAGSDTAVNLGMHIYSTRTDNVNDVNMVDMGFHYNDPRGPVMYTLTTSVTPEGKGSIVPEPDVPHLYPQFSQVDLVASVEADSIYQFKAWYGTDDDSRKDLDEDGFPLDVQYNVVTIDANKTVTAEFETRLVSLTVTITTSNGTYELDPEPYDERRDLYIRGTVVEITVLPQNPSHRIEWTGTDDDNSRQFVNTVTLTEDKEVFVSLTEPRTLDVGGGGIPGAYTEISDAIFDSEDGDTIVVHNGIWHVTDYAWVIDGKAITIRSTNPDDPCVVAQTVFQNRLYIENVGPDTVIAGITFRDFGYFGVGGGNGNTGTECDGFDGSPSYGGALRIGLGNLFYALFPEFYPNMPASPTIVNCIIDNISVEGGDGGNAGCPGGDGGWGGKGYGGGAYIGPECNPTFKNIVFRDCSATGGDGGDGVYGGSWGDPRAPHWFFGPYDEDFYYTGRGGAVFCDVNSSPLFIDCLFENNIAIGGSSGTFAHYRIDHYAGAAYMQAGSNAKFTNCNFIDNIADSNSNPYWKGDDNVLVEDPDQYVSYGGTIGLEGYTYSIDGIEVFIDIGKPVFENCVFTGSSADIGGVIHYQHGEQSTAELLLNKCTFTDNTALHGGVFYSTNGTSQILECTFSNNTATSEVGEGGALYLFGGITQIADSNITSNSAVASGGGLFLSDSNSVLWNCLIANNISGRDGGGVSANIYSDCNIVNCTVADNVGGKFGGGLYCSYNSYTHIIDSIIWGNFAVNGHQIAVASDDPYYPEPSVVEISYSDVGPRYSISGEEEEESDLGQAGGAGQELIESEMIYDQIGSTGWAEVVITLPEPVDVKKNTDWDSPAWVAELQEEIYRRQQAVLSTLTAGEFTQRYRYDNVAAFSGLVTSAGLDKLLSNPQVSRIEPVRYAHQMLRQAIPLANATVARQQYDGSGVAVAIIDTGIDYRHPMLGGGGFPNEKVIGGYDVGEGDEDPIPVGDAHGTCCAGVAAGSLGSVGDYIGGVAYNAKLYALKASVDDVNVFAFDAALAAWDWTITHRLDNPSNPILVMTNSLGSGVFDDAEVAGLFFPAMTRMAENAVEAGITILGSSGNDGFAGQGISYPAALSDVISVGAVYDTTDQVAWYSNTANILDILAPADPIYTTDMVGTEGYDAGDYFPTFGGTSSACPFAAGVVASLQSAALETFGVALSPEQVRTVLAASGDPVTDTKVAITKPRVNLGNAIKSLFAGPIYVEEGSEIRYGWWDPVTMTWDANSYNLDIDDDPLFVEGYYLSQKASYEDVDSNAVDAGSMDAHTAGKYRHTTRTDWVVEDLDSLVDMGYHYIRTTELEELAGDFNFDGQVDMADFARMMERHWLEEGCDFPDWCHGIDLNKDGRVDNKDYAIFADNYGNKELIPPEPNPMVWEIYPHSAPGEDWIKMVATKAKDNYGGQIAYYIQRTNESGVPDGRYRDWDPNRVFVDEGLVIDQMYGYRVKARDARLNETEWSVIAYVVVGAQSPPYAPTNLTAQGVSTSQINMAWTDNSYDEDGFKIERRTGATQFAQVATVGSDVAAYQDVGLAHSTTYTYRVCAYNAGGDSPYSNEATATTFIVYEPNEPNMITEDDPNCSQYKEGLYWYHLVVAEVPDLGVEPLLWFRFECVSTPVFSSDWIDSTGVFPQVLPHPVAPGFPDVEITLDGQIVTYTIAVKEGGNLGWSANWRVCASYNADGTGASCSEIITIPQPPP